MAMQNVKVKVYPDKELIYFDAEHIEIDNKF